MGNEFDMTEIEFGVAVYPLFPPEKTSPYWEIFEVDYDGRHWWLCPSYEPASGWEIEGGWDISPSRAEAQRMFMHSPMFHHTCVVIDYGYV